MKFISSQAILEFLIEYIVTIGQADRKNEN